MKVEEIRPEYLMRENEKLVIKDIKNFICTFNNPSTSSGLRM